MQNTSSFDKESIQRYILHPEEWKIISSAQKMEVTPVPPPADTSWFRSSSIICQSREILLCLNDGDGVRTLNNRYYPYRAGYLFLMDINDQTDYYFPPGLNGNMFFLCCLYSESQVLFLIFRLEDGRPVYLVRDCFADGSWFHLFLRAWKNLHYYDGSAATALLKTRFCALVQAAVIELLYSKNSAMADKSTTFHINVIMMIQRYIEQTQGRNSNIADLARKAGLSKFHFMRLFKKHTGKTLHEYVNQVRLKSMIQLEQEGYLHKNIASALGFSSPSAYCSWKKKHLPENNSAATSPNSEMPAMQRNDDNN